MFYFFSIFSETESTRGAWGPQPTLEHDEHGRTVPHEPVPSNSAVRDKGGRRRHWGDLLKPRCPVCSQMAHIHKAMLAKTDFPLHPCRRGRETGRPRRRCAQHAPGLSVLRCWSQVSPQGSVRTCRGSNTNVHCNLPVVAQTWTPHERPPTWALRCVCPYGRKGTEPWTHVVTSPSHSVE